MTENNHLPLFLILFFGYAGSSLHAGFSLVVENKGYSLAVLHRLLLVTVSLTAEHELSSTQVSVAVALRAQLVALLDSGAQAQ